MTSPTVAAVDSGATLFDTAVSDMQSNVTVSGGKIKGTLKKLTTGPIPGYWGEGYFMALDFTNIPQGATVKVGFNPTYGSGFVELDEDHNGVFKVTDKNAQKFYVITTKNGEETRASYDLSQLVLSDS